MSLRFRSSPETIEDNLLNIQDTISNESMEILPESFKMEDTLNGEPIEQYQCGICSKIFSSKENFIERHLNHFANKLTCCKCNKVFADSDDLYDHHEVHKDNESYEVLMENESQDNGELILMNQGQGIVQLQQPDGTNMVYILDNDETSNDLFVNDNPQIIEIRQPKKSNNVVQTGQFISLEHGYVLSDDTLLTGKIVTESPKRVYSSTKPRVPAPRKRHQKPNFTSTDYVVMEPNEEVECSHFKCIRCEQLFINKFAFFRHIEKGKCYVNGCDVCSSTFPSNSQFYAHYLAEHMDRAICNFCFRTFMYEKNVKEHMLRHLDQFRHRCEDCNKGFYTVREYRNHYKNRHMGIRHTCNVCKRSFADEYYFRKHVETHSKALPKSSAVVADNVDTISIREADEGTLLID